MRRAFTLMAAVAFVLSSVSSVLAQAKPDFSGKWMMDPASAPPAGGGGGRGGRGGGAGFGQEFTAKQDAGTLTITRMQGDQTVTATYKLDGSESKNTVTGRGGEPQDQVSKAMWDGSKLVITTTLNFGGNTVEQKRTLSMEGGNLVVEQVNPGRGGGEPTTTRVVYKKS